MSRLTQGGLIDRSDEIPFSFDGKPLSGFAGDTLASALVANDVRLVGRSFKYHRPRGLLTSGSEEPNALVTIGSGAHTEPNTRATTVPLYRGLEAHSQNRWPSLGFDALALNQLFAPLFVAGFYYKTFMWPASFWEKVYEPLIRRAAGLGALSGLPDPDSYGRMHAFCDLLIIGGGPSGLAAALVAGRAGLRVILADEDVQLGGRLLSERHQIDAAPALDWVRATLAELSTLPSVRVLTRTTVFGLYDGHEYAALERVGDHTRNPPKQQPRQRLWKVVARNSVLASGALERPIVFGGNDRPGVMLASAVSTYINRFAASPGRRVAVFTCTDSGWRTAEDLALAGVQVAAVVDSRPVRAVPGERLRGSGAEFVYGGAVEDVIGRSVRGVNIRGADGAKRRIEVDALAISGGWSPSIGLATHLGARPAWSDTIHSFVMPNPPRGMRAVGAAAGHFELGEALRDGAEAAVVVAAACGRTVELPVWRTDKEATALAPLWRVTGARTKAFVDLQNDVTDKDIRIAAQEGFVSVEHLKRYTTLGMATDQGKTGQLNGHALLADLTGRTIAETGTIKARPPYVPVAIGALAGHSREAAYRPLRKTAGHACAVEQGATFVEAGWWVRPRWFARPGERDGAATVRREVIQVRNGVGVCDVSTLGKIEVAGPDAAVLLDRLYINDISNLPIGKMRYGVMLREDGIVLDDGTVSRLAEQRFYLTTTTANIGRVLQHIDFARQVIWPDLDVVVVSVTEQWSTYAVAGPRARALLERVLPEQSLSNTALPYQGVFETVWRGVRCRIFRVSFSGELAYEIAVPSLRGDCLLRHLFAVGQALDVVPYGTEAQTVMRIEKGYAAGPELNGQTSAADLGLSRMMSTRKDFIGRTLAQRPAFQDPDRPRLIGLRSARPGEQITAGAHLLAIGAPPRVSADQGYVSSATFSPALRSWIALAFLKGGLRRIGERLRAVDAIRQRDVEVEVCSPVFFDPEGKHLRG